MSLFEKIKIDKLKALYNKREVSYEDRQKIDKKFRYYFPNNVNFAKFLNVMYSFTPTKLVRGGRKNLKHNLQSPLEEDLLHALEDITLNNKFIQDKIINTEIHLTKDLLLNEPVNEYISMLSKKSYSHLVPETIESQPGIFSLYLHYKRSLEPDGRCKFVIKLYDKSLEYYKNNKTYICPLYEVPSQKEIIALGKAYNKNKNTINLEHINYLRIEIELHESCKILPITKELYAQEERLTALMVINAMKKGCFYPAAEKIFTEILRKHIFNKTEDLNKATENASGIRKLACQLLMESESYQYNAVAEELGLHNQFSEINKIVRKVAPSSDLYNELYNKLFPDSDTTETILSKLLISDCNPYSSKNAKYLPLIYQVPILDDS